jgi:hypothetical protein
MLVLPFLVGADGKGCQPGGPIPIGSGDDSGAMVDGGSLADVGTGCTPASCAGLAAPALAKTCPDGTTLTASVCEEQPSGQCAWGFPACPTDACVAGALPCVPCPNGSLGVGKDANGCDTCPICAPPPDAGRPIDACAALPCVPCPNGSLGVGKDANGCDTCPICAPPPDAGRSVDACATVAPICNLPNCRYGVIARTDASGCEVCPECAPAPDASAGCTGDADCSSGQVCGFLETDSCGAAGSCFPAPMIICNAYGAGCACDGSEVNMICNGLPAGYARKALKHTGPCVDGG